MKVYVAMGDKGGRHEAEPYVIAAFSSVAAAQRAVDEESPQYGYVEELELRDE